MRMKLTMKRIRVTVRATRSKFRRTEGELILKNICKTLKATWLTDTTLCVYLMLTNKLPTQNKC